jgi:predicted DNA-binding protein (MmcQ/YjbR family)
LSTVPAAKLALYQKLIAGNPAIERKGDTNPYTSYNGHMFTHLAPPGTLAIRLSPEDVDAFLKKYRTTLFESYGVVKKDWVVVPDALLAKTSELRKYFERSFQYVQTLKPKATAKKRVTK